MHLFTALLLGISTNLDNLFIGLSFGFQNRRIPRLANVVIGLLSAAATCLFCYIASLLAALGRLPNIIGGILIILIGLYTILPHRAREEQACAAADFSRRETLVLGCCLAINCVPVALGAGLTGISPLTAALSVGGISVLSVALGNRLGLAATTIRLNPRLLSIAGGIIRFLLGLTELFI